VRRRDQAALGRSALSPGRATPDREIVSADRISPEEDATLRRLHWFERFGVDLAPPLKVVKATIRSRDKRSVIRDPDEKRIS
jgi:hypothetical protein